MRAIAIALFVLCSAGASAADALAPGSKAPPFSLLGSDGRTHTLAEYAGKQGVVLAWFPKAFTPGWSEELKALRDSADALAAFDAAVFMLSLDEPDKNRAFAKELQARHVLLSDPGGEVARAYGVTALGGLYARRWTFYIDTEGIVREIDKNVDVRSAGQDIAGNLARLGFPKKK